MNICRQILTLFLYVMLSEGSAWANIPPSLPFTETFEESDGGFTTTGPTSWKWGVPTSGPTAAHSGSKVWGTNLLGDYGTNENGVLTSPVYDLSASNGKSIVVRWWQFLLTESGFDFAKVEVSKDSGGTWATVLGPRSGAVNTTWAEQTLLLDESYAVAGFQIRFTLSSDNTGTAAGFYVDDLRLAAITLSNVAGSPQDFEAGDGGFAVAGTGSSWSRGTPSSGPGVAHSGTKAWGTNLAGLYNANEQSTLTSPAYDLSSAVGNTIVASWWQFIETEEEWDTVTVEVSKDDGATWSSASHALSGKISPEGWVRAQVFLDDRYAATNFKLRFSFNADATVQFSGVYIDDVAVKIATDFLPALTNITRTTPKNITASISRAMFTAHYQDLSGGSLTSITIDPLPTHGILFKGAVTVNAGDSIAAADLDSLRYQPELDYIGGDSFQWKSSNDFGTSLPATVTLSVLEPAGSVMITTQPVARTVNPGATAIFEVIATGAGPLSYQWRRNLIPIQTATGATLTITSAAEADEDTYDVVVTNGFNGGSSETSETVALTVNDGPTITSPLADTAREVYEGADTTLEVTASGTGPLNYQWTKDGDAIPNATSSTLTILDAYGSNTGGYRCVVTNVVGATTSSAVQLNVRLAPLVVSPPKSTGAILNTRTRFTVSATGADLTYQWLKDGVEIPGATESTLTIPKVVVGSTGFYRVRITNPVSSVTTDAGELTVRSWTELAGTYQGLLIHDNSSDLTKPHFPGRVTVKITPTGSMSGVLNYQGRRSSFSGHFSQDLKYTQSFQRGPLGQVEIELQLDPSQQNMTVNASHRFAGETVESDARLFGARYSLSQPSLHSGRYNARLNSSLFTPGNFVHPSNVVAILSSKSEQVSEYLWDAISPQTQALLQDLGLPETQLRLNLAAALNQILQGASIYDVARFAGVTLSAETTRLIAQNPTGEGLIQLNRLLIEQAYPGEIEGSANVHGDRSPTRSAPGFTMIVVQKRGQVRFLGKLPDGTPISNAAFIARNGSIQWYCDVFYSVYRDPTSGLYRPRYAGSIAGPVTLDPAGGASATTGIVDWRKIKGSAAPILRDERFTQLVLEGSVYQRPPTSRSALVQPVGTDGFKLTLTGPIPGGLFERALHISDSNQFRFVLANPEKVSLTLNKSTGFVKGSFFDKTARRIRSLHGVLLQAQSEVGGLFIGELDSGEFTLTPIIP